MRRIALGMILGSLLVNAGNPAFAGENDVMVPTLVMGSYGTDEARDEVDLSQVVLSAGKRVESVQETASIITVVTRDQIQARSYRTLSDVLDDIPGFEAYRPAHVNDTPEALARGNARTILVLWNGVPLNSPDNNKRGLGRDLSLDVVQRIEVVSGPGGVLWGANALLGIVNIVTLRADSAPALAETRLGFGDGAGDQSAVKASASLAHSFLDGSVKAYANLTYFSSQDALLRTNFNAILTPFPTPRSDGSPSLVQWAGDADNTRDVWLPLTLAVDVGPLRFDVLYPLIHRNFREHGSFGVRTDFHLQKIEGRDTKVPTVGGVANVREENVALASVQYSGSLSRDTQVVARGYFTGFEDYWVDDVALPPGGLLEKPPVSHDVIDGDLPLVIDDAYRSGAAVDVSHSRATNDLIFGGEIFVEGRHEKYREVSEGADLASVFQVKEGRRLIYAAFLNDKYRAGKHVQLTGGLRGQYSASYDALVLGSMTFLWNPFGKTYFKVNYAQGFRPPALLFILGNDDPVTNPFPHQKANPGLKPERSQALEAELSAIVLREIRRIKYLAVRVGYQATTIDNLVVIQKASVVNAGEREMHSVEARMDLSLQGGHRVTTSYNYLQGVDVLTGPIRHIANHKVHLGLELKLHDKLEGILYTTLLGPREDYNRLAMPATGSSDRFVTTPGNAAVDRLPPAAVASVALRATRLLDEHIDVDLHVSNLFDNRYAIPDQDFDKRESPFPIPAAGLSAFVTVTGRL
jgi:outer membrane cobalamin receptor